MSEGTNRMSATKLKSLQSQGKLSPVRKVSCKTNVKPNMTPKRQESTVGKLDDLLVVGQQQILEQNQREKEMRHNSKSIESVDGGRDLHEVLKPKGIQIYSSNQVQIHDDSPSRSNSRAD